MEGGIKAFRCSGLMSKVLYQTVNGIQGQKDLISILLGLNMERPGFPRGLERWVAGHKGKYLDNPRR